MTRGSDFILPQSGNTIPDMVVRIAGLDYHTGSKTFECPDHPEQKLEDIVWGGTGYVCEAPLMCNFRNVPYTCLNYAEWLTVEERDLDIKRLVREARQDRPRMMVFRNSRIRLPEMVRHLFTK